MSDFNIIRDLRDVATGKTRHVYTGTCPEAWPEGAGTENDRADPQDDCPACEVLRRSDALLEERCGACAEVRYTGVTTNRHACREPEPVEMIVTAATVAKEQA